jgi:hypothetical protein
MEALLNTLKTYLNESNPADFKVRSVTDMSGNTVTYNSYSDLLKAYQEVSAIVNTEKAGAFQPIKIGQGRLMRGSY